MVTNNKQVVQPEVSRIKFDKEIAEFRLLENEWRKKGVICLKVEYPVIEVAFTAHLLKPPALAFAVSIDFTNYDVEPPSIIFIDPLSAKPILTKDVNVKFVQMIQSNVQGPNGQIFAIQNQQGILVGEPNDIPFLCIPGVREYHNHPTHTGNSWLLHRNRGEGKLAFLLNSLYDHSIPFAKTYNIHFNVSINQQF